MTARTWVHKLFERKPAPPVVGRHARLRVAALEERATPALFTVTAATDTSLSARGSGSGTSGDLRYCIDQALANPDADTITFSPALAGQTISLTTTQAPLFGQSTPSNDLNGVYGRSAFFIGQGANITIDGAAAPGLVINAASNIFVRARHFTVHDGGTLSLRNLTITGGAHRGGDGGLSGGGAAGMGGAVFVNGSTFTAEGCTFTNNRADGGNGGDGIFNRHYPIGRFFLGNGAGGGGGLGAPGGDSDNGTGGNGGGTNGGTGVEQGQFPSGNITIILDGPYAGTTVYEGSYGRFGGGGGGGGLPNIWAANQQSQTGVLLYPNGPSYSLAGGTGASGGLGAGGGGGLLAGGDGGFGGGGGGGLLLTGPNGHTYGRIGIRGFNGGNGGNGSLSFDGVYDRIYGGGGGGGAGMGGAIFSNGGTVGLSHCTFGTNVVTGGLGGSAGTIEAGSNGQTFGSAVCAVNGSLTVPHVSAPAYAFAVASYPTGGGRNSGVLGTGSITFATGQLFGTLQYGEVNRIQIPTPTLGLASAINGAYNGQPQPATVHVRVGNSGAFSPTLFGVAPTVVNYARANGDGTFTDLGLTPPTAAGSYRVTATMPATPFSLAAQTTFDFTVQRALPGLNLVRPDGYAVTNLPPAQVTVAGVNGVYGSTLEGVAPTLEFFRVHWIFGTAHYSSLGSTEPTTPGNYAVTASFPGSPNYQARTTSTTYTLVASTPSLVVTTAQDEDDGTSDPTVGTGTSLREAVAYAESLPGQPTVTFAPPVHGAWALVSPLTIGDSMTLQGPGMDILTVGGLFQGAVITVAGGANVAIRGMQLRHFADPLPTTVTLGGVLHNAGTLTLDGVKVGGGRATFGGGIFNAGGATLTVTRSVIELNTVTNSGGGVYNADGATLTLTDTFVYANGVQGTSGASGGGVTNSGGTAVLTGNTFLLNGATGPAGSGGGVAHFAGGGGTMTLSYNLFVDNYTSSTNPDVGYAITSHGFNTVSNAAGSSGWVATDRLDAVRGQGLTPTLEFAVADKVYDGAAAAATGLLARDPVSGLAIAIPAGIVGGGTTLTVAYYAGHLTAGQVATATPLPGAPTAAGAYTAVATFASQMHGYASAVSVPAHFTVSARPIAVVAHNHVKAVGQPDPTLTYAVTAGELVAGDAFSGALARAAGEVSGAAYAIDRGTLTAGDNYALTFAGGALFVTDAAVALTGGAAGVAVLSPNDPLTLASGPAGTARVVATARQFNGFVAVAGYNANPSAYLGLSPQRSFHVHVDAAQVTGLSSVEMTFEGLTPGTPVAWFRRGGAAGGFLRDGNGTVLTANAQGTLAATATTATTPSIADLNGSYFLAGALVPAITVPTPPAATFGAVQATVTGRVGLEGIVPNGGAVTALLNTQFGTQTVTTTVGVDGTFTATFDTTGLTAGSYPIYLAYAGDGTFAAATATSILTIEQALPTMTVSLDSFVYEATAGLVSASVAGIDGVFGQQLEGAGLDFRYYQGTTPIGYTPVAAGTYAVEAVFYGSANYRWAISARVTYTISPRAITVTADANQGKTYGDDDPALLTWQITSGELQGNDAITGNLSRAAGANVGNYAIAQGTLSAGPNYVLSYQGANFQISPRAVTATADAGQGKVYGNADPALTYTVTAGNLVGGDMFSGTPSRAAGENVGGYAIGQGTLALSSNYALTFEEATFAVTPRAVAVTADPQAKVYGNADPTLTYQITAGSLAFTDEFAGALTRDPGKNVGAYAIRQGTLTLGGNYDLTFTGADLTITRRALTVAATGVNKVYDGTTDATVNLSDDRVAGDELTTAYGAASFADRNAGPGKVVSVSGISVTGTDADNYTFNLTAETTADITRRGITVTADALTKVAGTGDPTLTYQVTAGNLVAGEAFGGQLTRDPGEAVGAYAIRVGSLSAGDNYDLQYIGADLTITAAARVAGVAVNAGQANAEQRSRVTSITVTFDAEVTFAGAVADAFGLSRVGGGAVGGFTATAAVVNGVTVVTLSGFTGDETEFGSLADGRYRVLVRADRVSAGGGPLDGDGDGLAGGDYAVDGTAANGLFRLFGDADGSGVVNAVEYGLFRNAFGSSTGQAAYLAWLDFDGDGVINAFDYGRFVRRFGGSVP